MLQTMSDVYQIVLANTNLNYNVFWVNLMLCQKETMLKMRRLFSVPRIPK